MRGPGRRTLEERLDRKIVVAKASHLVPDACWLWQGARVQHRDPAKRGFGGYGLIKLGGGRAVPTLVHRLVYEREVGPIPAGHVLDHLCGIRNCCNPAHLEPVTHGENIARGFRRRRAEAVAA